MIFTYLESEGRKLLWCEEVCYDSKIMLDKGEDFDAKHAEILADVSHTIIPYPDPPVIEE